jgi:hypothetical protein
MLLVPHGEVWGVYGLRGRMVLGRRRLRGGGARQGVNVHDATMAS